jgi:hypothetical protein
VPSGVQQIFVMGPHYENLSQGGDTPSTPMQPNALIRSAIASVVTAEAQVSTTNPWVILTDIYGYQQARIAAQTDPNFSPDTSVVPSVTYNQLLSWHVHAGSSTTNALLSTGAPITSISTASAPALASGAAVTLASAGNIQTFVTSGPVAAGATSVPVNSQTPNFAYPSGTAIGVDNLHHNSYGHQLAAQSVINGGPNGTALPEQWIQNLGAV